MSACQGLAAALGVLRDRDILSCHKNPLSPAAWLSRKAKGKLANCSVFTHFLFFPSRSWDQSQTYRAGGTPAAFVKHLWQLLINPSLFLPPTFLCLKENEEFWVLKTGIIFPRGF